MKGYNFYQFGKVLGLYSKIDNGFFYIKLSIIFIFKGWIRVYCKNFNRC